MSGAPQTTRKRSRVWAWLDERLGLGIFRYDVPHHANTIPYALGGAAVTGFTILILTGILLAQGYHPSPSEANDSIRAMTENPFMKIVRSIHYWAAQLTLALVLLHLVRVFLTASYKRPREMQWVIGVLLLALSVAFYFTGTILKWDQEGYEALQHNDEIAAFLSGMGVWFAAPYIATAHVVQRFYSLHVSLFPLALGALILTHFYLVKHHKISELPVDAPTPTPPERREPFSRHLRNIAILGGTLLALAIILALALPAPIGPAPIDGIEVTKPPWPFLWLYGIENYLGIQWLFPSSIVLLLLILLVPFVDRNPARAPQHRKLALGLALATVLLLLGLSLFATFGRVAQHL